MALVYMATLTMLALLASTSLQAPDDRHHPRRFSRRPARAGRELHR